MNFDFNYYEPVKVFFGKGKLSELGENAKIPPGFAAPDPQIFKNLVDSARGDYEDFKAIAQQNGIIAVQDAKSGIAKEWDFRAEESLLKITAQTSQDAEIKVAELFMAYIGQEFEYEVKYPVQFSPSYGNDRINQILLVQDRMPPRSISNMLWISFAEEFWKGNQDKIDEIKAANEQEKIDKEMSDRINSENDQDSNNTENEK